MKHFSWRRRVAAAAVAWLALAPVAAFAGGPLSGGPTGFAPVAPPPAPNVGWITGGVNPGLAQPNVAKPYYYQPPPANLNSLDQLQLKAYSDQLYWQNRALQVQQSQQLLTPEQQRILDEGQRELARADALLAQKSAGPVPAMPPVPLRVGPRPLIAPQ